MTRKPDASNYISDRVFNGTRPLSAAQVAKEYYLYYKTIHKIELSTAYYKTKGPISCLKWELILHDTGWVLAYDQIIKYEGGWPTYKTFR